MGSRKGPLKALRRRSTYVCRSIRTSYQTRACRVPSTLSATCWAVTLVVVSFRRGCIQSLFSQQTQFNKAFRSTSRLTVTGHDILKHPFASNVIVSEINHLIYCPIPKAANSNWKYVIRKLEGLPDYANLANAHNRNTSGLRYLSDYSAVEVEDILRDPAYFKFVFVRNPYRRLVSCYMDKFQNREPKYVATEYRSFLAQLMNWHYARGVDIQHDERPSFRVFVDELTKHEPASMNAHWMPQTILCGLGSMPYDFIGRMESLQKDARLVFQRLGRANESFPTQDEIGFPPSGASDQLAAELYTEDLKLKVRAIYDADFRILGYS